MPADIIDRATRDADAMMRVRVDDAGAITRGRSLRVSRISFERRKGEAPAALHSMSFGRRSSDLSSTRTVSFGRKNKMMTGSRTLSFTSARRGPRMVTIFKQNDQDALGLTLAQPDTRDTERLRALKQGMPEGIGVLVSRIAPDGLIARSKRTIVQGDFICAINGVRCHDYMHARDLLQGARGVIQLLVVPSCGLPDGWEVHRRDGVNVYRNAAQHVITLDHPAAWIVQEDLPLPKGSALDRWHIAFHMVSVCNSLVGQTSWVGARDDIGGEEALQHERL